MPPRRKAAGPGLGSGSAPASRTYESTPVPQQVRFPARRRIVRTYGRRSLPAALPTSGSGLSESARRRLRQQTLTQVGYVRAEAAELEIDEEEEAESGERIEGDDDLEEVIEWEEGEEEGKRRGKGKGTTTGTGRGRKGKRRRKTMGDAPMPNPASSFHTQTLTQFLGERVRQGDALRVEDEDEDDRDGGIPPPLAQTPTKPRKRPSPSRAGDPHTPSNKRIKVNLDEVPSSQPTPFTPMLGYSPIQPARSPLKEKSTNVDAPPPTEETISKWPRNLVIQDSYSQGNSPIIPSSSSASLPMETPKKEEKPKREPLAEIPVASLELGGSWRKDAETPTGTRSTGGTRAFAEIPDSDAELESNWSTPFKGLSTHQTPLKDRDGAGFEIASDPGSGARTGVAWGSGTPTQVVQGMDDESAPSTGKSNKENEPASLKLGDDGDETASEEESPGTPTPTMRKSKSQTSQTAGGKGRPADNAASQLAASEESVSEDEPPTPTPAPGKSGSQHRASTSKSDERISKADSNVQDSDELTASEDEQHGTPTQVLPKAASQRASILRKRNSTPEVLTSESSTGDGPTTPTPIARRVQIELPPPSSAEEAEEVYEETPRKPAKTLSPIFQRHTQGRSQYYSQGLESQRVPMQVIRSLGPQTDRSDILISVRPDIVDEIVKGMRDHEFRPYRFPIQVLRGWIYTADPAGGEVKYMATLGPAKEPGEIDSSSGLGNAEFNAGTVGRGSWYAHELLQVYRLNNPVPLADMPDNGLGDGAPQKYRYIPPAIVGQLLANLRCALFAEVGDGEGGSGRGVGGDGATTTTTTQELEEQLRSDIVQSTQMHCLLEEADEDEDEVIPASQGRLGVAVAAATAATTAAAKTADEMLFARPAVPPPRSSQRLRNQKQARSQQNSKTAPSNSVRPSQATTASDISSSPVPSSPQKPADSSPFAVASVPRPAQASFNEPSLPDLLDVMREEDDDGSLIRLPPVTLGSSSQAVLLPPDSLLVEEVRQPPAVVIWDSEDDEE
ncbi:hypothetical protein MFIFM68171_05888 [Madurella fahalii]|uniref:Uncharacterized protein n=1 Tax=Madurella fahalii TaxID=1157608 RepID=A0ABQ0GD32_9PEZI